MAAAPTHPSAWRGRPRFPANDNAPDWARLAGAAAHFVGSLLAVSAFCWTVIAIAERVAG